MRPGKGNGDGMKSPSVGRCGQLSVSPEAMDFSSGRENSADRRGTADDSEDDARKA